MRHEDDQTELVAVSCAAMAGASAMARVIGYDPGAVQIVCDPSGESRLQMPPLYNPNDNGQLTWAADTAAAKLAGPQMAFLQRVGKPASLATIPPAPPASMPGLLSYNPWRNDPAELPQSEFRDSFTASMPAVDLLASKFLRDRLAGGPGTASNYLLSIDPGDGTSATVTGLDEDAQTAAVSAR